MKFFLLLFVFFSFSLEITARDIPYIILPKNNFVSSPDSVLFSWNEVHGINQYHFQISLTNQFDELYLDTILDNETSIKTFIPETGEYFWRARGCNGFDCGDWTNVYSFQIFLPINIQDNVLWLDASNGLIIENNKVEQWMDLSGSNNHANQINEANRPTVNDNFFKGNSSVNFNGIDQFLAGTEIPEINNSSFNTFIVANGNETSGNLQLPMFSISPYPNGFWITRNQGNEKFNVVHRTYQSGSGDLPNSGFSKKIFQVGKDFNNSLKGYLNNEKVFETTTSSATSSFNNSPYNIGYANYQYLGYYNGEIAEIIIYLKVLNNDDRELVNRYLRNKYSNQLNLGENININYGFKPVLLSAPEGFSDYYWSTDETDLLIEVTETGKIWLNAKDKFGFSTSDTIQVLFPNTELNIKSDSICFGETITLYPQIKNPGDYYYEWSTSAETHSIEVSSSGNYWVKITDSLGYFAFSDTIAIFLDYFPDQEVFETDTFEICSGEFITPFNHLENESFNYYWSTGDTTFSIPVIEFGLYSLTVTNENNCSASGDVFVSIVGNAPETNFEATTSCLGSPTEFTDLSQVNNGDEITSWYWDFGNGNFSEEQNPEFTFSEAGNFEVNLTVTTSFFCEQTYSDTVQVLPNPKAYFETQKSCINIPYQLFDMSIPVNEEQIESWKWYLEDSLFSTEQNPSISFEEPGDFSISLIVSSTNGCIDSYSDSIQVFNQYPTPAPFTHIYPKNNQYINPGHTEFLWNKAKHASHYNIQIAEDSLFETMVFDIGEIYKNNYSLEVEPGEYFIRIKAYNICQDYQYSQHTRFFAFSPDLIEGMELWLTGDSIVLEDTRVSKWIDISGNENHAIQNEQNNRPDTSYFLNKLAIDFSTNQFFTVSSNPGINPVDFTYFVLGEKRGSAPGALLSSVIASWWGTQISTGDDVVSFFKSDGSGLTVSANYNLNQPWLITFSNNNPNGKTYINNNFTGNHGKNVFYSESVDLNIGRSSAGSPNFYDGKMAEVLLFSRELSETELDKVTFYIQNKYSPPLNLGFDKSIAYGFCPIILDAGDRFESYLWSTGDTTQTIEAAEPGTYSVTVTDIFGFESSDSLEVRFPDIFLSHPDTLICKGDVLSIGLEGEVDPSYSFLWSNGSQQQQIEVSEAGHYELQVTDSLGCQLNLSVYVEVDMFPETATLGDDRPFCMGDELGLLENGPQLALKGGEAPQDFFRNYTYQWSTGATTPTIVIDEPGDYALTVTNPNGCVATDTVSLSFQGYAPEAAFEADAVCPGEPMQFNDQSSLPEGNIVSWEWLFEDGGSSQEQHPEYLWETDPGIWNVELTVTTDSGCSGTVENDVQIWHLPDPAFTPLNACHGQEVSFSDQSSCPDGTPAQWEWSFYDPAGNLTHTSDQSNPDFTFPEPGNWELKLITTSTTGCSDSLQYNMNVRTSPDPAFEWTTACIGEPVHFTDQSSAPPWAYITSRQWDFGDGNTSDFNNPSHLYSEDGIFEVALTVQAINGCEITLAQPVTVHSQPEVDFVSSDLCLKEPFTFTDMSTVENSTIAAWDWNFGGKGSSNEQNPTFAFGETGQFGVRLAATSEAGCTDSLTKLVDVFPAPESSFTFYPRFGVSPLTITFNNETEGATGYLWNFGDGSEPVTTPNPQHTYTENGIYYPTLVAYSDMGCADTTYREIKVIPLSVDIAVTDVNYAIKDNFLEVSATLQNLGTLELDTLLLDMKLSGRSPIREKWTGLLRGGDITSYTFNASLPMRPGETYDYVCVEASIPGIPQDDNPDNDTYCKPFESAFRALPPRPNPAREFVEIGFVLPYEGQVEITFFDMYGNTIGSGKREYAPEGISFIKLSTAHLRPGTYFYRITFRESSEVKKFMKW